MIGGIEMALIFYQPSMLINYNTYSTSKPEVRRLENQHRLCYSILGRQLFLGCVNFPEKAKILDIGCSSGIWALEMAEKYPQATVIGLDISPQQTGQPVPPNCSFVVIPLNPICFGSLILVS